MIDVLKFQKKWAFLAEKKIFIACSGGVDSIVLSHLIKGFCTNITLLHVNYNLRENESLEDENFVRDFAKKNALHLEIKSIETKKILAKKKGNLQEIARKIRYNWFEELVSKDGILLLAHHQDDQIETFYQNLARKSGILGLSCMLEKDKNKMRPLLNFSKDEIYSFAKENKLSWREDSSNKSNKYSRNRLRNEFLPYLYNEIPTLKNAVLSLIQVFQKNQFEIEKSVKKIILEIQKSEILDLENWRCLTVEQQVSILKSFSYSSSQLQEINKLLKSQKGKFVASPTHQIIREDKHLFFKRLNKNKKNPILEIKKVEFLPDKFSKNEIYLDASKISGDLKIEFWKIGDRISPLGMKGSKLISDIITEEKTPNSKRKEVLILRDDNEIHWCIGLKIGRNAIATERSEKIILVRLNY